MRPIAEAGFCTPQIPRNGVLPCLIPHGWRYVNTDQDIVDKKAVSSRLIREAVWLFFNQRDNIAIHTVIASAHQVLFDLGKNKGLVSAVKNHGSKDSSSFRKFLKTINFPYNFFKHADRDAKDEIDVSPLSRMTEDFILDAILMLQNISGEIPFEAKVYWHWFVSAYPEEFDNCPKDGHIAKMQKENYASKSFKELAMLIEFAEVADDAT